MITSEINFRNFKKKKITSKFKKKIISIIKEKNQIIKSLSKNYKDSFNHKDLNKYKNLLDYRVIGMGGSTLGTQAIYEFLKDKIKKNFLFVDNLQASQKKNDKKKFTNLIV